MLQENEKNTPQFKCILEFPNKIRIYCADEQLSFKILERYGVGINAFSSDSRIERVENEGNKKSLQPQTIHRCPECGSSKIAVDSLRGEFICMSCGWAQSQHKPIENMETPRSSDLAGYRILENENAYLIVRKSKKSKYTNAISKPIVEEVYRLLRTRNKRLSASEIGTTLNISNVSVYNALRILEFEKRTISETSRDSRQSCRLYRAV